MKNVCIRRMFPRECSAIEAHAHLQTMEGHTLSCPSNKYVRITLTAIFQKDRVVYVNYRAADTVTKAAAKELVNYLLRQKRSVKNSTVILAGAFSWHNGVLNIVDCRGIYPTVDTAKAAKTSNDVWLLELDSDRPMPVKATECIKLYQPHIEEWENSNVYKEKQKCDVLLNDEIPD